ncbi:MAG: hypothetical protein SOZ80_06005 [Prevotella sp.]|uniref:hypothetical protein n=1 Tax=Prevotella sp. TaxID=59823 RepID=UPI002A31CEEE|nr:hypothetical protein [Prevotella sp.]MDD7318507.1 hypothetical protein [Prevotellaceae bacterium]MDY4020312.1 hypothetical protein [Prevotella sp.]
MIRSNLSKANEQRGPRNVEYFAYILIEEARRLREGDVDETFFYRGDIYAFKLFGGAGSIMTKAV